MSNHGPKLLAWIKQLTTEHCFIVLLVIGTTAALVVRLWNLETGLPFASDEGNNGYLALSIARDGEFILRGVVPHFGALTHYLTAGIFLFLEPSVWAARLVPALASAAATALVGVWLWQLTDVRGAVLGMLLTIFSPWMITYGRITWEMAPNVFFITAAAYCMWRFLRQPNWRWAVAAGTALGAAANGHLYIAGLIVPYLIAVMIRGGWHQRTIQYLAAMSIGFGVLMAPLVIASYQNQWDLFVGYGSTGAEQAPTINAAARDAVGYVATLFGSAGGWLGFALVATGVWLIWYAWRTRDRLALFFLLYCGFVFLVIPQAVGPENATAYQGGICETISQALGGNSCEPTQVRYMDIFYPLPIVVIAWAATRVSRHELTPYLLLAVALIAPLVPPAVKEWQTTRPERIEHARPLLTALPPDACIILNAPPRDYRRLSVVAGWRRVFTIEEYREQQPTCESRYLLSAMVPRRGAHLQEQNQVIVRDVPLWYLYKVVNPTTSIAQSMSDEAPLADVACPAAISDSQRSRVEYSSGWVPDAELSNRQNCAGDCSAEWEWTVSPPYRNESLAVVVDCGIVDKRGPFEVSIDDGRSWTSTCDHKPSDFPTTRWIDTGLRVSANTDEPITIDARVVPGRADDTFSFDGLRLCLDPPEDVEQLIWESPLKWI